jgi:hypothetical protein
LAVCCSDEVIFKVISQGDLIQVEPSLPMTFAALRAASSNSRSSFPDECARCIALSISPSWYFTSSFNFFGSPNGKFAYQSPKAQLVD